MQAARLPSHTSAILAQQSWQAGAGAVTVALVALCLSPVEQGWYYTLLSLAALASLMDFGLLPVLAQRAARLFIATQWDRGRPVGEEAGSVLALAAWGLRVHAGLALVFIALMLPGGWLFLGQGLSATAEWRTVFVLLVVAAGLTLLPQPLIALVEGSGAVGPVYRLRLLQGVSGAVACWALLLAGGGLWSCLPASLAGFAVPLLWLWRAKPGLLAGALAGAGAPVFWRQTLWPLQWRIGMGQCAAYFLSQTATPIVFAADGAHAAGQMGLSLTLCTMVSLMGRARFLGHGPAMTQAAHRGDWEGLRALHRADFRWFALVTAGGAMGVAFLGPLAESGLLGGRILSLPVFLMLYAAIAANALHGMLAGQLRAFGEDPLAFVTAGSALLTFLASLAVAPRFGTGGVTAAMLAIQLLIVLPASLLLWRRFLQSRRHG